MKSKIIFLALVLLFVVAFFSLGFFKSSVGPHNGIVKPAGDYNIEMTSSFHNFNAYLLDKKLTPISNKGITCEVKFYFADSTSIVIPLLPYKEDGFMVESTKIWYSSCIINFNVYGKSVSASFENVTPIITNK